MSVVYVRAMSAPKSQKSYSLLVYLGRSTQGIYKVAVHSRFVDTVELTLEVPEVSLT